MQEINTLIIPQTILNISNNNINNRSYLYPKQLPAFLRKKIFCRSLPGNFSVLYVYLLLKNLRRNLVVLEKKVSIKDR